MCRSDFRAHEGQETRGPLQTGRRRRSRGTARAPFLRSAPTQTANVPPSSPRARARLSAGQRVRRRTGRTERSPESTLHVEATEGWFHRGATARGRRELHRIPSRLSPSCRRVLRTRQPPARDRSADRFHVRRASTRAESQSTQRLPVLAAIRPNAASKRIQDGPELVGSAISAPSAEISTAALCP